jgi:hypothetical protein
MVPGFRLTANGSWFSIDGWFFKEKDVMNLVISGGSKWDIIAMNVKRPLQVKSFTIL